MNHLSPDPFEGPGGSGDHTRTPAPARQSGREDNGGAADEIDGSGREQRGRSELPGIPRGLGNEDESTEAQVQAEAAEVAGSSRPGRSVPVAKSHRELSAGDDNDRRLPGH